MATDEQGGSVGADEQTVDPTSKHKDDGAPVALRVVQGACVALVLVGAAYGGFLIYQAIDRRFSRKSGAPRELAAPRQLPRAVPAQREPVPA